MKRIERIAPAVQYRAAFDMSTETIHQLDKLRRDGRSFRDTQLQLNVNRTIEGGRYEHTRALTNEVANRLRQLGDYVIKLNGQTRFSAPSRHGLTRLAFAVSAEQQPHLQKVADIIAEIPSISEENYPPYHLYCDVETTRLTAGIGHTQDVRERFARHPGNALFVHHPTLRERHISRYPIPYSN